MSTDDGAETKAEMRAMLPRNNGRGVPEAQVPEAARPAPYPAYPRNCGGGKRKRRRDKKKRRGKEGNRIEERIQKDI